MEINFLDLIKKNNKEKKNTARNKVYTAIAPMRGNCAYTRPLVTIRKMKNKQLFENIIDWQIQNKKLKGKFLANPIKPEMVAEIEGLLNEKFPEDLLEIYRHTNGQNLKSNERMFLGLIVMNLSLIHI